MRKLSLALAIVLLVATCSCKKTGFLTKYGIFHVKNETTVVMNGTIGGRTLKHFDNLIEKHPNIELIVMENCPGSRNDEVNLKLAKKVHDLGINMQLNSDSEIASGAVDLFLAGEIRTITKGAKLGVHSWAGNGQEADQLPENSPEHDLYINYYKSIGMTEQAAREFYFYTIRAAKANDIHWMTEEEIEYYNMATP